MEKDQNLQGNEKIEEVIWQLQKEPTQEMLAHALTVVRRRMKEDGHLIVAVDPAGAMDSLQIQTVQTGEGKQCGDVCIYRRDWKTVPDGASDRENRGRDSESLESHVDVK